MVYTVRFAGGPRRHATSSSTNCAGSGIVQKNSRPNHPTTCGKVERFQQTMKKWLRAQPDQPATMTELQALLDPFLDDYNQQPTAPLPAHRAHPGRRLRSPPESRPRRPTATDTHDRVRDDKIDNAGTVTLRHNGRLHHIGVGRTHAGTHVLLLVHDLDISIINAATGEILRELTLDPTRDYQPTAPPGPTRKQQRTYDSVGPVSAMS